MNSGLYHSAKPHAFLPVPGFDISVKFTFTQVSEEDLTYDFYFPHVPFPVTNPISGATDTLVIDLNQFYTDRKTPTVFGETTADTLRPDPSGIENAIEQALLDAGWTQNEIDIIKGNPDLWSVLTDSLAAQIPPFQSVPGIGVDILPLIMPQVSMGLPFKSEVLLRYMPEVDVPDFGKVTFLGVGLKHNLSQWIPVPMFPVDITGQFVWQQLTIGDLIESKHTAFNLHASKKLGLPFLSITPYVGVGFESSSIDVTYEVENPEGFLYLPKDGTPIEFSLKGKNKSRLTGGVRLGLTFLTINADYSMGEYDAYSLGVGLTLR